MPDPAKQPTKPIRTWRPMAAWTAGILLALGLAWFVGAVVVPVWRTRASVDRMISHTTVLEREIACLGGPEAALGKLSLYIRLPSTLAPHRSTAVCLLGGCGPKALASLLQLLKAPEWDVRRDAATGLGIVCDERAVPALIQALQDHEREVRWEAAGALGKIGGEQAVEALVNALQDKDHLVVASVMGALGNTGGPRAVQAILPVTLSEDRDMRRYAAKSLGRTRDASTVPRLTEMLKDQELEVRHSAAEALGGMGDPRGVAPLTEALGRATDDYERRFIIEALKKIRGEEPPK